MNISTEFFTDLQAEILTEVEQIIEDCDHYKVALHSAKSVFYDSELSDIMDLQDFLNEFEEMWAREYN